MPPPQVSPERQALIAEIESILAQRSGPKMPGTDIPVPGMPGAPQLSPVPFSPMMFAKGLKKTADDSSRSVLNGLTFGFGDNMEAAVNALPFLGDKRGDESLSQAYTRNLEEIRGQKADFRAKHPVADTALDVAGAVLPIAFTGGAAAAPRAITTPLSLGSRIRRGAGIGAAIGGVSAVGNSDAPTVKEVAEAGLKGAAVGGVFGGAMPVLETGARKVAEGSASAALGLRKADRMYGKTPAAAVLDETSGFSPAAVGESASRKISELQSQIARAKTPVDISKAQQFAQSLADEAATTIDQPLAKELQEMANALTITPSPTFHGTVRGGNQIGPIQSIDDVQKIKRAFSKRFLNWNSTKPADAVTKGKEIYHRLDEAFDDAVPGGAELNQRISSLIPVVNRAEDKQLGADTVQRALMRGAAHTGGSVGAIYGGVKGLAAGGIPGMVAGGALGLAGPELLASPAVEMAFARGANAATKIPTSVANVSRYAGPRILLRDSSEFDPFRSAQLSQEQKADVLKQLETGQVAELTVGRNKFMWRKNEDGSIRRLR